METLHILNGEGTAGGFRLSGIEGEIAVWNEALVEGPVHNDVGTEDFFDSRRNFIVSEWEGKPEQYNEIVISEFEKIEKHHHYEEVVLWFEFDLFCQINMLALLSWLHQQQRENICLICIDSFPDHPNFHGLGELRPEDYPTLLLQKQRLSKSNLDLASEVWAAYQSEDPTNLVALYKQLKEHLVFPYLHKALQVHFQRFPSIENGLNYLEQQVVKQADGAKLQEKQIVRHLLDHNAALGYGDSQYFSLIKSLSPILNIEEEVSLNESGKKVLAGEIDYLNINGNIKYIGGARNVDFRWNGTNLIKTEQ